jgi:hypothetical protein
MTGAMKKIDIHTDAGISVREKWEQGPRTDLGIMIAGCPNLLCDEIAARGYEGFRLSVCV